MAGRESLVPWEVSSPAGLGIILKTSSGRKDRGFKNPVVERANLE